MGELPGELFKQARDSYIDVLALLFRQDGKVACTHTDTQQIGQIKKKTLKSLLSLYQCFETQIIHDQLFNSSMLLERKK